MRRALPLTCTLVLTLVCAAPAGARKPRPTYLALGDSVTFAYHDPQVTPTPNYRKASTFRGYAELVGSALHVRVVNAACPGETSASLVNASAQSNGCENSPGGSSFAYRKQFPLHVKYRGSQLSFAVSFLRNHPRTRLVSLMVGANDLFLCQTTTSDACLSQSEQDATFARIRRNVRTIVSTIRRKAHYRGQLVLVRYYSLDYTSAFINGISRKLNSAVAAGGKGFHVTIADGYGQFKAGAAQSGGKSCEAGLLDQLGHPGSCGVHPSYSGHSLLALAVERVVRR